MRKLVLSVVLFLMLPVYSIPFNQLDIETETYFSSANQNYSPTFGDSSVFIGEGSVNIFINETVGVWLDDTLTIYQLANMSRLTTYPCEQIKDRTNNDLSHPIAVNRDRMHITCANHIYKIGHNSKLETLENGTFTADFFAQQQNFTVHTSSDNGCRWSTPRSLHSVTVNNSTILSQSHCSLRDVIHIIPSADATDVAIVLNSPADPDGDGPLGNTDVFNSSGSLGSCGGGSFSSNQGIYSKLTVGTWHEICTISSNGTYVYDLRTNIQPVDYRAHENCGVAVTTSHLISGSITESIAGASSVDCLEQNKVVVNRNGYLEYWWTDTDGDGVNDLDDDYQYDNTQQYDSDGDGYGDNGIGINPDGCPYSPGNSYNDVLGCPDSDSDGWSDSRDIFPFEETQWNDTDLDGYGDEIFGIRGDDCPATFGTSTYNNTLGCPDQDFDGWADIDDKFQLDSSQWLDDDNDGFGNELNGFEGDSCPSIYGNSSNDRFGCLDSDSDGWSDDSDALPNNPTQWLDRDGDGFGDNQSGTEPDVFPTDGTQWIDLDNDGYGDNILGNQGDAFPDDPLEWKDSDGDYLGDNADMFPFDPTQTEDRDGDGMGDNQMGIGADKFPDDPTQWGDIDGDGYGDNPLGNNPDVFITDATQWFDEDGDGYGDNPTGRLYDQFPQNPTQWEDADEDGLGDNQSGTNADPFLNDFDNDGYNDSIDILPKLASPGDLDADGCLDEIDAFPSNSQECVDTDGDGVGDNADSDDDGDGWTDADEERLGTDSLSASEQPVDSFEIVIPGTAVGLGAWDLIGIFGGVPFFAWIGFGFATRNGRTAKYEELLRDAQTRDELEGVARKWEYSLMLRMLGPHQGIRLERLRAELDDVFEAQNQKLSSIEPQEHDQTQMVEQAIQAELKSLPSIESAQPEITAQGNPDSKGYEWYTDEQETSWYRNEGSNLEWQRFES